MTSSSKIKNSSLYREYFFLYTVYNTLYFWPSHIPFQIIFCPFKVEWVMQHLECRDGSSQANCLKHCWQVKALGKARITRKLFANQLLLSIIFYSIYLVQWLPDPGTVSKNSITLIGFLYNELLKVPLNYGHRQKSFGIQYHKKDLISVFMFCLNNFYSCYFLWSKSIKILLPRFTVTPIFIISTAIVHGNQFSFWSLPEHLHFLWDLGKSQRFPGNIPEKFVCF